MFDSHVLLREFTTKALSSRGLIEENLRQPSGLVRLRASTFRETGSTQGLHNQVVHADHLRTEHALERVLRLQAPNRLTYVDEAKFIFFCSAQGVSR
jgi:hypothetical protein